MRLSVIYLLTFGFLNYFFLYFKEHNNISDHATEKESRIQKNKEVRSLIPLQIYLTLYCFIID